MKTLSDKFAAYREVQDIAKFYVLKLTDGSSTWYFSNQLRRLTDGACFPFMTGGFSVKEGFDMYSRQWKTPTLSLSLNNENMVLRDDGSWRRVLDIIANIRYQDAILYAAIGEDMDSIADMLVVVDGLVASAPEGSEGRVKVELTDRTRQQDVRLPKRVISQQYTSGPTEFWSHVIPIAYGRFIGESDTEAATGLMMAIQITLGAEPKFVVADHICDDITHAYLKIEGLPDISMFNACLIDEDDAGLATVIPQSTGSPHYFYMTTKLRPIDNYKGDYVATHLDTDVVSLPLALDRQSESCAEIMDWADAGSNMGGRANFCWGDYSPAVADGGRVAAVDWTIEILASFVSAAAGYWAGTLGHAQALLYYQSAGGVDSHYDLGDFTPATAKTLYQFLLDLDVDPPDCFFRWIEWKFRTRESDNAVPAYSENDIWPFMVGIYIGTDAGVTSPAPNGVARDQWLMRIYDIRLSLFNRATSIDRQQVWAEGNGREYASWITGRSSNYASGDAIEDPVGIVESILRDEIGLDSTRIDAASFIAAENTSVKARLNLHNNNMLTVYEIVKQLVEQSMVACYVTAAGKWRAVNLSDKTPTTDRIIHYSDIMPDKLTLSKTEVVVNRLLVSAGWREEFDAYSTFELVNDTISQAALATALFDGIFANEANWPNINGATKDLVAAWLVNTTDGVWSKEHRVITAELQGWKHVDLECGNTIEIDATSADPHILCHDDSWAGHQFIITYITYKQDRVIVEAVELY